MSNKMFFYLMILSNIMLFSGCIFEEDSSSKTKITETGFTVSGRVVDKQGQGVLGVSINIKGNNIDATVTTDIDGYYSLSELSVGHYSISVKKLKCTFEPSRGEFNIKDQDIIIDDILMLYVISGFSGRVVDLTGKGMYDVTIELINKDDTYKEKTNLSGEYQIYDVKNGTYTLTVYKEDSHYVFELPQSQVIISGEGYILDDIIVTAILYSIRGSIINIFGNPVGNIGLVLNDGKNTYNARTSGGGYFEFLVPSGNYILSPQSSVKFDKGITISISVGRENIELGKIIIREN